MEPLARGWRNGVSLIYFFGWVIALVSGFFHRVPERAVGLLSNVLCRSVCCGELSDSSGLSGSASPQTSASERSRSPAVRQSSFSRLSGRIQALVRRVLCLQRASDSAGDLYLARTIDFVFAYKTCIAFCDLDFFFTKVFRTLF